MKQAVTLLYSVHDCMIMGPCDMGSLKEIQ